MGEAKVVFWDVQHGHAAYIKTPNNRHIVVDLGIGSYDSDETFSPLKYLKNSGIGQLDYVVITHPHLDHIDDILNFDSMNPKVLLRPKKLSRDDIMRDVRDEDRGKFEKYFEIDQRYSASIKNGSYNDTKDPNNWGGMVLKSFSPLECATSNINNHSIIFVIEYATTKIVFTGDNESCSFNELMQKDNFKNTIKNADILLAPHHGRDSGYHNDFISQVNPSLTVISDGRFNENSATSKYSSKSRGWSVVKADGSESKRYALTTRQDGIVTARFGYGDNQRPYLYVATKM
ncbi:MAG: MBL fold metallo-hydrolase [Campylobacterales bacterium]|nr:MBL fold metallo-hydrolase [Campylobacterales bacterium]